MENYGNLNPKMQFIAKVFGPTIQYLEEFKISGAWIGVILLWVILYFSIFYKRSKKQKFTFKEKYLLLLGIGSFMIAVVMQIWLLINF